MFKLNLNQLEKFNKWAEEQDALVMGQQKGTEFEELGCGGPYYGCSGGQYTYMYTPTSLGGIYKIRHNLTENEIDLTDYENW